MSLRRYVLSGVYAGVAAGVVYLVYSVGVSVPLLEAAESAAHTQTHEHGHGHAGGGGGVDLTALGTVAWSVSLGVFAGVLYYLVEPILAPLSDRVRTAFVAAAGFWTFSLAPWLVSPPVSPEVSQGLSPDGRVLWYWLVVATAAVALLMSTSVYRVSERRTDEGTAGAISVAFAAAPAVAVALVAPSNPLSGLGSLDYLYTLSVVTGQIILWTVIAAVTVRISSVGYRPLSATPSR